MEIISVGQVIGRPVEEIEVAWGEAASAAEIAVGAAEELPSGGWGRTYSVNGYELLVNYDHDEIAQGMQVTGALAAHKWKLEQWPVILMAMGMMVTQKPNQTFPAALKWFDFQGYGIHIFAERHKGIVWTVRIFRARKRSLVEKLLGR